MISDSGGIYPYIGPGVVTRGGGVALTQSTSDPSHGWNVGLQGQSGAAYQLGYSFSDDALFFEMGGGVPGGGSLTGYYVFGPFGESLLKPLFDKFKPRTPIQPAKCH
ncbi:MAG: hypothetical protein EPN94_11225 [Nitrospirae bacterium]|nr:MAG: hypothetical protein EPN94_11225 [Nitrospirota bacterium]